VSEVLVVDDTSDIRRLTRLLLESAGHRVREAASAEAALAAAAERTPEVILLDLHLNGTGGWAVLDLLAGQGLIEGTRVVIFTAEVGGPDDEGPVDARLTKPFTRAELLASVNPASEVG
jgi:CheY-like chemotaxis protein